MDFDYILIDSFDTLNYLKNNGLNKTIKILSFNPYLVLKKSDVIISPEQFLKKEYYSDLGSISKIFTGKLFEEIIRQTNNRSLGVYVSQYLITIQNILHRASIVHKIIGKKKLLIIYTDYSQKGLNKKVNGDFYNLMEKYDNIFLFKLKYEGKDQYKLGRDPVIKFTTRLNFEALSSILFRLSVIVCSKVSKYWKGKKVERCYSKITVDGTEILVVEFSKDDTYLYLKEEHSDVFGLCTISELRTDELVYTANALAEMGHCMYAEIIFNEAKKEGTRYDLGHYDKSLCSK